MPPSTEGSDSAKDVFNARRYFFIHVMKTGGRTLIRHLRDNFDLDEVYPYGKLDVRHHDGTVDIHHHLSVSQLLALAPERRTRVKAYAGHYPFVICDMLGGHFETMTVLRHPVSRTVSLLRELRRTDAWADPSPSNPSPMAAMSLEDVYSSPQVYEPLIHNHQTKIFSMKAEDRFDTYMDVIDVDQERLRLARENLAKVDVVGLTESYEDFVDELSSRFGWKIQPGLRKNVTPATDADPVSDALRRQILADNAIDMEFYRYAKDLVGSRRQARAVQT